jgi:DGQHR domain-containing protein
MKIEALQYCQRDKDIYVFSMDPHYIKSLVKISDVSADDKNFQRPFDPKRVAEIKTYILGKDKLYKKGKDVYAKGYMPNAIVVNLPNSYKIEKQGNKTYIHFPDEKDIKKYKETIEIIDGQHRLLAFDDECKTLLDAQQYKMCFVALFDLSDDEKKEIFMVLNERQKTVDKNILLRHKKLLKLLLDDEETRYDVITRLNSEVDSPFYDKLIIAGEKKVHGLKTVQIDSVLNSSKALEKLIDSKGQIAEKSYKILKNYFLSWKDNFPTAWFKSNNTLTKMAGFRFMSYLFPFVYDILKSDKDFTIKAFSKIISKIKSDDFNEEFDIKKAGKFSHFQEQRGIIRYATQLGKELREHFQDKEDDILV